MVAGTSGDVEPMIIVAWVNRGYIDLVIQSNTVAKGWLKIEKVGGFLMEQGYLKSSWRS